MYKLKSDVIDNGKAMCCSNRQPTYTPKPYSRLIKYCWSKCRYMAQLCYLQRKWSHCSSLLELLQNPLVIEDFRHRGLHQSSSSSARVFINQPTKRSIM